MIYSFLANAVLTTHVAFVFCVVLLVPCIFLGGFYGWNWIRIPWIRLTHLIGVSIVMIQSWFGIVCPLTTLEMWLRKQAGTATYSESFIEYWLQKILYWQFPWWVFVFVYTLFASLIIATWFLVPPKRAEKV